jgi:hypothetical protein
MSYEKNAQDGSGQIGDVEVRSGYFGLCSRNHNDSYWTCASSSFGLGPVQVGGSNDPLGVVGLATAFKDDVIFPGLQ